VSALIPFGGGGDDDNNGDGDGGGTHGERDDGDALGLGRPQSISSMVRRVDEITTAGGGAWDGQRNAAATVATEDAFGGGAVSSSSHRIVTPRSGHQLSADAQDTSPALEAQTGAEDDEASMVDLAAAVMHWQRASYAPTPGAHHIPVAFLMETVSRGPGFLTSLWPVVEAVFARAVLASAAATRAAGIAFAGDVITACVATKCGPAHGHDQDGGFSRSERLAAPLVIAWRSTLGNSRSQVCVALRRLVEEAGHAMHLDGSRSDDAVAASTPGTDSSRRGIESPSDGLWGVILPLVAQAASGELGVTQQEQELLEAAGRSHDAAIVDVRRRRYPKDVCDAASTADLDESGAATLSLLRRTSAEPDLLRARSSDHVGTDEEKETPPSDVPVPSILVHAAACPALALASARGAVAEVLKCAGAESSS